MRRPVVVPRRGEFVWARLRVRRRDVLWWLAAAGLGILSVAVVGRSLDRADAAADRWGQTRRVWVTTGPIDPGRPLAATDLRTAAWPQDLVPAEAVVSDPTGRTATAAMGAGEAVTERRLAPDGVGGTAALLPPGTRAVAVPTPLGSLALSTGDVVDVVATSEPRAGAAPEAGEGVSPSAAVVAEAVTVVAALDETVTVAVPVEELGPVVAALHRGGVTLAQRSPLDQPGQVEGPT